MAASNLRNFVFCLLFICKTTLVFSQKSIPLLEKKVTIHLAGESVETVLRSVSQQGGFTFSYAPLVISGMKPVSIDADKKPVREVLSHIFEGQVTFKQKGNHIILVRTSINKAKEEPVYFLITGYIIDGRSGDQVKEVSVFEKKTRVSAVTNNYGYFTLRVEKKDVGETLLLNINKANYKDTIYYVKQAGNTHINVTIYPEQLPEASEVSGESLDQDSLMRVDQMSFVNMLLSKEEQIHTRNIKDTIYRKFQVSFVPFLGSNLRLSGNTVNDYSLNVLGGYSMGTRKFEAAGLFNIDRDSVKHVQLAGLFNVVGGHVEGVQAAGLFNANLKSVKGVELAGLMNVNGDSIAGAEFAGLMNINLKPASGFQGAGLMNINLKEVHAVQAAGLMNIALHRSTGAQVSGLMNICGGDIYGAQISGLLNFGTRVHGSQIGVFNFSDTVAGIPVGFLSFVRKGYHQLEVSSNESFPLNLSLRTGVRSLYNILEAGMKFGTDSIAVWYFGYGLGTAVNIGKNWQTNFDLTMSQPLKGNELNYFNPLTKFNVTFEKRFSRYFSLAAGPTLNVFYYHLQDPTFESVLEHIVPSNVIGTSATTNYKNATWLGGKIALRFF